MVQEALSETLQASLEFALIVEQNQQKTQTGAHEHEDEQIAMQQTTLRTATE